MSATTTAYLNLVLAMVIVGSSVVAGKIMVAELPVFLSSAIRFALALVVLLPLIKVHEGGLPAISRRSWVMLALQSLCGSFLFTVFLLYGLTFTAPSSAGIVTATTPACMGVIAWLFLNERPSNRASLGIILSVAGVIVINLVQDSGGVTGSNPLLGNLLVLGAVIFESLFLLMRKTVPEPLSPLAVSTIISLFGLLWFLPVGLYELTTTDLAAVSTTGWLTVVYYGLGITVLAYLFWFAGITKVPASTAGVFTAVMPVSALILSALILGEPIGWAQLTGCACVLGGIVMISK
ncbi:DMT family transporter [Pseudodesulfovibrio sp. zrk46]|uniref:DMT family transporter n=1 Tax=Pseudodesulfovibrio sp. zrk46 TaxID=2725288 RepID=UPI001449C978|nr:DMT family transporter [Pseudodesulfovibrio sp. zrk46]QJB56385.1 DMT family transporter [Pseudodesulfovibrio sp. zrk46]